MSILLEKSVDNTTHVINLFIGMDISCRMLSARMATVCGNLLLLISRRSVRGMTQLNARLENGLLILRKYFSVECSLLISSGISFVIINIPRLSPYTKEG